MGAHRRDLSVFAPSRKTAIERGLRLPLSTAAGRGLAGFFLRLTDRFLLASSSSIGRLLVVAPSFDFLENAFFRTDALEPLKESIWGFVVSNCDLNHAVGPPCRRLKPNVLSEEKSSKGHRSSREAPLTRTVRAIAFLVLLNSVRRHRAGWGDSERVSLPSKMQDRDDYGTVSCSSKAFSAFCRIQPARATTPSPGRSGNVIVLPA